MEKWFFSPQEAGTDEAGRGCLAGPVTAAAVILPEDFYHPLLNDSKQMTEKQRNLLRPIIEEQALSYAVVHLSPERIDQINILNASIEAMHQALDKLTLTPEFVVVDGNRFKPYKEIPYSCQVKGDGRFMRIAAASVLAKTYRDAYMETFTSNILCTIGIKTKDTLHANIVRLSLSMGLANIIEKHFNLLIFS